MSLVGRAISGLATMLLVLMLLVALCFSLAHFVLGWQFNPVLGEGMSPAFEIGDVAMIKSVEPEKIEVGDNIVYYSPLNGEKLAHRVMGIHERDSQLFFRTKADTSEDEDPYLVPSENVVGRAESSIPLLGYMARFVRTPLGFTLFLWLPGLVLVGMEIRSLFILLPRERRKRKARWATGLKEKDWLR